MGICVYLHLAEAHEHEHSRHRSTFVEVEGIVQPAPAPRFSRTPSSVSKAPSAPGADTEAALADWGVDGDAAESLRAAGALG